MGKSIKIINIIKSLINLKKKIDPNYKYEIKGKILFLAPLDNDGEPVSGDCIAMVKQGYDFYDEFDEVTDPYWCTYE